LRILRSVGGVAVGFGLFVALIMLIPTAPDAYPANYLLLSVTVTVLAAMIAGYLTAMIAGSHEFPHVATLGFLMVVVGFVSMRQASARQPGWQEIAIAGCGPVSAMIGGAIRLLTKLLRKRT
jgi:hypothetical protein